MGFRTVLPFSPLAWSLLTATVCVAGPLAAQGTGNSHIAGTVHDAATRQAIAGARVLLVGTPFQVETDAQGGFRFRNLKDARYTVQVIVPGVDSSSTQVNLAPREQVTIEFLIGARMGMVLPEITVTAAAGSMSGRTDFERRLAEGAGGRFLTKEYIQRRKPQDLMDLMRGLAGARVECATDGYRCAMRFARSPRGCSPQFYMDGMRANPSVLYLTLPTDVAGIEVYSGPAQVPTEFASASSRCGVIAIWTHNGRGGSS